MVSHIINILAMKTVFVVLHYCQKEITEDCVKSLLALEGNKEIVVVDNASPDRSGIYLSEKYKNEKFVHVILNSNNLGFASGNNMGYAFAKKNLAPECIVVMNNDTVISDKAFLNKLEGLEELCSCEIIAPDILTYKGYHQNPYRRNGLGLEGYELMLKRKLKGRWFYSIPFLYKFRNLDAFSSTCNEFVDRRVENVVPHGAAVIFTSRWIDNEGFAFYPGTFMYYEEDLLYCYAMSKNYRIVYEPSIQIRHLEDASTNAVHKNVRKRVLFQTRQKIKSLRIIVDFLRANQ